MKVCNLIFDFNFMFHSEFAVYTAYNRSAKFSTENDEISFVQGVANKLFYALGHLPNSGKIVCCVDSRSWRKSVEIPGTEYKASRESADGSKGTMDKDTKDKFYSLMDEFSKALDSVGIISSRMSGAEGDDLIFKWSEYFKSKGENVIIISGDRDLTQLVCKSDDESYEPWIIQWNNSAKNNKMFIPAGWQQNWLNTESTIFNMNLADDRLVIKRHINDFAIQLNVIQSETVILEKILLGDDGDDVPPAWSYPSKTKKGDDKIINLTAKFVTLIMSVLNDKYKIGPVQIMSKFDDDDFMTEMAGIILRVMKTVDGTNERIPVVTALRRNKTLVHLSADVLPVNLQSDIDTHIDTQIDGLSTQRHKWNRKGLFQGTRFAENAPSKKDDPYAFFKIPD